MKAFDFDDTLYRGESSIDYVLFMIKKNKKIILWIPKILFGLIQYKLCLISKEKIENQINDFLKFVIKDKEEIANQVREFWEKFSRNLNQELINTITNDDVIITASPSFLIEGIKNRLGTANLICSEFDLDKKCVLYFNFGENKVKKFYEVHGNSKIECFYTDSYNDKSMMDISDKVFLVKKRKIKQIK